MKLACHGKALFEKRLPVKLVSGASHWAGHRLVCNYSFGAPQDRIRGEGRRQPEHSATSFKEAVRNLLLRTSRCFFKVFHLSSNILIRFIKERRRRPFHVVQ